ncbi:MAG: PAS domain S-box protein [Deltaproteobacteria bacterium]|nr:PAS domain S-box protein [Deltaproteobacteria bacterium]
MDPRLDLIRDPTVPPKDPLTGRSLLLVLRGRLTAFLDKWPRYMKGAGYLEHTTAKREDCAAAFRGVLEPFFDALAAGENVDFPCLIKDRRGDALFAVNEARRHRFRGITAEMYLGCFKTLAHSLEEILTELDAPGEAKFAALKLLRSYLDAVETVFMGDWTAMTQKEADRSLDETNRRLTLEKNKYQNILDSTRDLVFITDAGGLVQEMNAAAQDYFEEAEVLGQPFWSVLGLEGRDLGEVFRYYSLGQSHEISLFEEAVFVLKMTPLSQVSLASDGFMLMLNNISCVADQRARLERRLWERTRDLEESGKLFSSLFRVAPEGILLVDTSFAIVDANQAACRIFGQAREELCAADCRGLAPEGPPGGPAKGLGEAIAALDEGQVWVGELVGLRGGREPFPMEAALNRVDLEERSLFYVMVHDITGRRRLEENLHREKTQLQEMNVTLRNVMKSVDQERREAERTVTSKIEVFLLPALERISLEPEARLRNSYLELIREQLIGLTHGFSKELDARLLKLTRTEMAVCQHIQAGLPSKDIAEIMNLSYETVQTHRKSIRKKLGLSGQGVNLYTYLAAKSELST